MATKKRRPTPRRQPANGTRSATRRARDNRKLVVQGVVVLLVLLLVLSVFAAAL